MPPRTEPAISREKLFEQLKYKPHSEEQWAIHMSTARYRVPVCGRRWGKSTWAGHEMTYKMFVPESVNWIVGPTYPLGEKEFRVVWKDFKRLGLLNHCQKSYNVKQGNMRIYFKELDSLLEVKSAERKDSLVGEGVDHVIMSEAARHDQDTWELYVEPTLLDVMGSADFPSTPRGFNWYEQLYNDGQKRNQKIVESWCLPTWTNNALFPNTTFDLSCPNINDEVHYDIVECNCDPNLVRVFNKNSLMGFLQEYAAQFTAFEGLIFPEFAEHKHVMDFEYNPAWANWWALDFGYSDPFVCLDIMIDPSDRVYVWREYVLSYRSTHEHGIVLKNRDNPAGFHIDAIAADPRGADEIATLSYMLGSINANSQGVSLGVEAIKRQLKLREDGLPGLLIHPRCTETIRSLKSIHASATKSGYEVPRGQYDHPADALRYFHNEYFVMGGNFSLAEVYAGYSGSETAGFVTYESDVTLNSRFS